MQPILMPRNAIFLLLLSVYTLLFSCKKEEKLNDSVSITSLRSTINNKFAEGLFAQLLEYDKKTPVINQIVKTGVVDWQKVAVDVSGSSVNAVAYVFPINGETITTDLLLFQFSADQKLVEIKILHYDPARPAANIIDESRMRRMFLVLEKQGAKISGDIHVKVLTAHNKTMEVVNNQERRLADFRKAAGKSATPGKIGADINLLSDAPPVICHFYGEWHYVYTWLNLDTPVDNPTVAYQFRNSVITYLRGWLAFQYGINYVALDSSPTMDIDITPVFVPGDSQWYIEQFLYSEFDRAFRTIGPQYQVSVNSFTINGYAGCSQGGIDIDGPPPGGGGTPGGGENGTLNTDAIVSAYDIVNNLTRECYINALELIKDQDCRSYIAKIIHDVFQKDDKVNILFFQSDNVNLPLSTLAQTSGYKQNGVIWLQTTLNDRALKYASQEMIVETIIHELIHGYMDVQYLEDHTSTTTMPELVQHIDMADNYVFEMRQALREVFPNLTDDDAAALVLSGLGTLNEPQNAYNYGQLVQRYAFTVSQVNYIADEYNHGVKGIPCPQ